MGLQSPTILDLSGESWWCNVHQRPATHVYEWDEEIIHCCDPQKGGIMIPCSAVNLTGIATIERDGRKVL